MIVLDAGEVLIHPEQIARWRTGELREEWFKSYPFLFDDDDLRIARSQPRAHFYEWLGAIVLYHGTGFHSLVEKYAYKNHPRKRKILEALLPPNVRTVVLDYSQRAQCPDLLMYAPDFSDWFFCEVKGPTDRLRAVQTNLFALLKHASAKHVRNLRFRAVT